MSPEEPSSSNNNNLSYHGSHIQVQAWTMVWPLRVLSSSLAYYKLDYCLVRVVVGPLSKLVHLCTKRTPTLAATLGSVVDTNAEEIQQCIKYRHAVNRHCCRHCVLSSYCWQWCTKPEPEMARNEGNLCPNFQKFLEHRKNTCRTSKKHN